MQNEVGIMQGRLSARVNGEYQAFPENWQEEFEMAEAFGFKYIEYIYGPRINLEEVEKVYAKSTTRIKSICADKFMDNPFFKGNDSALVTKKYELTSLIGDARRIGAKHITIPCVDNASLKTDLEKDTLIVLLEDCMACAISHGVSINLETDLNPDDFRSLLDKIKSPNVKVNYDMGNSASLGYDPEAEFKLYGDRIGVVHIKDRIVNGPSTKLGSGAVQFEYVFSKLREINFSGPLIMQVYREESYTDDLETLREQFDFVKKLLKEGG